jgi:hypothetical protein
MKKVFALLILVAAMVLAATMMLSVGLANAKALDAGVQPTADANGNVTIPALPNGKIVQVYVWNDSLGTPERKLGPVTSFKLNPGDGFNFEWSGEQGVVWQLVTPKTKPGGSLVVDTSWKDSSGIVRCKYFFPGPGK